MTDSPVDQFASDARSPRACVNFRSNGLPADPRNWPFKESARKIDGHGLHRVVKPEATFESLRPFFRRLGITRVANITHLDQLGIPVYSAFVPRSLDAISVYHGKGLRAIDAKTGAVMEATERYVAGRERLPDEVASFRELSAKAPTVDPRSINHRLHDKYSEQTPIAWLKGLDLLSGEHVFVPHSIACHCALAYRWQPSHTVTTSNGLASGNTIEEAACHALAEVIERDAHSILEVIHLHLQVLANRKPITNEEQLKGLQRSWHKAFPAIDPDTLTGRASELVECFRRARLEPELIYAGSECGAATVLCFLREQGSTAYSRFQYGAGADPNISVASVRAMTEVAQGRAACMEAVREDLTALSRTTPHPRSKPTQVAEPQGDMSGASPTFKAAGSPVTGDIIDDIRIMLDGLRENRLDRCIMVDLSVPEIPVKVIRMIVPGMESWIVDRKTIGSRAKARWREFAFGVH